MLLIIVYKNVINNLSFKDGIKCLPAFQPVETATFKLTGILLPFDFLKLKLISKIQGI